MGGGQPVALCRRLRRQPAQRDRSFDEARVRAVRAALDRHGIRLGLHTLSAVNVAETSPYLRDAVDALPRAPTSTSQARSAPAGSWSTPATTSPATTSAARQAALERLKRAVGAGRAERGAAPAREHEPGARRRRGPLPRPRRRRVPLLLRPADLAASRLGLHRQPRPHAARGHRGLHAAVRPRPLRRGAARRQPRRPRGAPASPARARSTSRRCSIRSRVPATASTT